MSTKREIWDRYGDWSQIAASADLADIRQKISGITPNGWQANDSPPQLVAIWEEISDVVGKASGNGTRVLDFGCGLGRNAPLLREKFARVVGLDLPDMIKKLRDLPEAAIYDTLYDDLAGLVQSEDVDVCFDSVVFQHIVDENYCKMIIKYLTSMPRLRYVVSLCNGSVCMGAGDGGWARVPFLLSQAGWEMAQTFIDGRTFARKHVCRVLRKS